MSIFFLKQFTSVLIFCIVLFLEFRFPCFFFFFFFFAFVELFSVRLIFILHWLSFLVILYSLSIFLEPICYLQWMSETNLKRKESCGMWCFFFKYHIDNFVGRKEIQVPYSTFFYNQLYHLTPYSTTEFNSIHLDPYFRVV